MKSNRQKAVEYADKWFSLYIRKRDPYCYCGLPTIEAGHLITRSSYSTRWDELNTHGSCRGCNIKHEYHPEDYTLWFINKYGNDKYEILVRRGHTPFKISSQDLYLLGGEYKKKYDEL